MTLIDHLFFLLVAVIHPTAGYFSFHRLLRRAAAGAVISPARLYLGTITSHWLLFAMAIALWAGLGRPWSDLGVSADLDGGFAAGMLLTTIGFLLLGMQLKEAQKAPVEELQELRDGLGSLEIILPRDRRELRLFYGLSLTAGIVEEVLWRGFLIWYLATWMPVWAAALIRAAGFGFAHAYQGPANLPRLMLVGAVFSGLYLLSGSLWLPIVLHTAIDVFQGRVAYTVIQRTVKPAAG